MPSESTEALENIRSGTASVDCSMRRNRRDFVWKFVIGPSHALGGGSYLFEGNHNDDALGIDGGTPAASLPTQQFNIFNNDPVEKNLEAVDLGPLVFSIPLQANKAQHEGKFSKQTSSAQCSAWWSS
ncbi:hypothetical protein GP486_003497 [Trichoglossum hirsutum]|uniref:Uncharacterized protein n=1 Tax=Trichoglossum hirsutum TaxID=265104 RepID=A0A9P8RR23_9PEZI|nr:hypothetical protein GP486_003497 [Trichoglossum hirsutum]